MYELVRWLDLFVVGGSASLFENSSDICLLLVVLPVCLETVVTSVFC